MGNKQNGEVSFRALSKDWVLRYGINGLCRLEDETGKSAIEVASSLNTEDGEGGAAIKISDIRLVFFCGLVGQHADVTLEQVGDIIDDIGIERAGPLLGEAFSAAFPDPEEGGEGKPEGRTKAMRA